LDKEGLNRGTAQEIGAEGREATSRRTRLVLVLGVGAVSASSILTVLSGAAPFAIAFYRNLLGGLILLPFASGKLGELRRLTKKEALLLLVSGLFLSIHFACWIASLFYTSISASLVLGHSDPIIVAALAFVFLGERPSRRAMAGFGIAMVGIITIAVSGAVQSASTLGIGDLLALAGAGAVSVYLLIGRRLRRGLSVTVYGASVYLTAAAFLFVGGLASSEPLTGFTIPQYAIFLALALGPSALGHTSFNYALKFTKASTVSVATLGEPVLASLLAILVFGQTPTAATLLGAIFVLGGLYYALT
jgi:drug/metabolite transporter (DMT)-like permease